MVAGDQSAGRDIGGCFNETSSPHPLPHSLLKRRQIRVWILLARVRWWLSIRFICNQRDRVLTKAKYGDPVRVYALPREFILTVCLSLSLLPAQMCIKNLHRIHILPRIKEFSSDQFVRFAITFTIFIFHQFFFSFINSRSKLFR